jgi:hypothetical protein
VATEHHAPNVELVMDVQGRGSVQELALALDELDGVVEVAAGEPGD